MNDAQEAELQGLQNLDQSTLDDTQKARMTELSEFKVIALKAKEADSALAQKEHFRTKFEKEETDRKALEAKLNAAPKPGSGDGKQVLDVGDYIDISASLDGLDQREKEYLASLHKQTGKPLTEIRKDENFLLWQSAYQAKVEKEKSVIPPSSKQPDDDAPISLEQALSEAKTFEEKEALLKEHAGYSIGVKQRGDRVIIGRK